MSKIARDLCSNVIDLILDNLAPPFDCAVRNGPIHMGRRAGRNGQDHPYRDIEAASQVWERWGQCALKHSELWAYIAIPGTCYPLMMEGEPWWTRARELMQRSENQPLVVCIDLRFVGDDDQCRIIEECLPRIKKLCLHNSDLSSDNPILEVLKRTRAPCMEKFSLDMEHTSRRVICDFKPGDLFYNDTPALRWLTVKPGIRAVSPSALSFLTRYTVLYRVGERTDDYDLHAELSLMKSLEVLEIEIDSQEKLDWENREEIHLERLKKIVIRGSLENCEQFLSKMRVAEDFWVEYPE